MQLKHYQGVTFEMTLRRLCESLSLERGVDYRTTAIAADKLSINDKPMINDHGFIVMFRSSFLK